MMKTFYLLALPVLMLAMSCSCERNGNDDSGPKPPINAYDKAENVSVRIVSYNVGAFGKYVENSTAMVASMMKEIKADAMILNELDRNNARHDTDQLADFATAMDWDCHFARAMDFRGGEYGNGAAWSKDLQAVDRYVISLPKRTGSEDRSCVVVEFDDFVLAGTHLEVKTEEDRLRGIRTITETLAGKYGDGGKPVFLCGDMNAEPSSATIEEFRKNWEQLTLDADTYPSDAPDRCIDYIFALKDAGPYTLIASDVMTRFGSGDVTGASDHLPVYADIVLE